MSLFQPGVFQPDVFQSDSCDRPFQPGVFQPDVFQVCEPADVNRIIQIAPAFTQELHGDVAFVLLGGGSYDAEKERTTARIVQIAPAFTQELHGRVDDAALILTLIGDI